MRKHRFLLPTALSPEYTLFPHNVGNKVDKVVDKSVQKRLDRPGCVWYNPFRRPENADNNVTRPGSQPEPHLNNSRVVSKIAHNSV